MRQGRSAGEGSLLHQERTTVRKLSRCKQGVQGLGRRGQGVQRLGGHEAVSGHAAALGGEEWHGGVVLWLNCRWKDLQ